MLCYEAALVTARSYLTNYCSLVLWSVHGVRVATVNSDLAMASLLLLFQLLFVFSAISPTDVQGSTASGNHSDR